LLVFFCVFFFQAEDGIRDFHVTGVQTCALPICLSEAASTDAMVLAGMSSSRRLRTMFPYGARAVMVCPCCCRMAWAFCRAKDLRSEERRVGKECRYRWARYL